ncbi:MAG: DUF3310 domain-containing protein [bacterium]|nr:DUF3310 domain-containing protein [bacterium]
MIDNVNHPAHYTAGGIETIDILEAKLSKAEFVGFLKGNVIKYITRSGHKNDVREDLAKAKWYLDKLLTNTGRA